VVPNEENVGAGRLADRRILEATPAFPSGENQTIETVDFETSH
jgi:hypothetical protein